MLAIITVSFNSSLDGFRSLRQSQAVSQFIVINNSPPHQNIGFAAGVNKGIKLAIKRGATEFLLLNPDCRITPDQVKTLSKTNGDIVAPVLTFRRNGVLIYDFGGKINWLLGRPTHIERIDLAPQRSKDRNRECDYVSGACMLIRRPVIDRIGFFDERFFLYFEDADFCRRAKKAGLSVTVNPNVVVPHDITEHRASRDSFKLHQVLKSNWIFVKKWIPWYFRPIANLYLLVLGLWVSRFSGYH